MNRLKTLLLIIPLLASGCYKGSGDVLVLADGSVIEGTLQSISRGLAVLDSGTAELGGDGRLWLLSGETYAGEITFSDGEFTVGAVSVHRDSVLVVVWEDTEVDTGTFRIDASAGWQDTGIMLEPGEMITIDAEGTVVTETGTSTPDGQVEFSSSIALAPGANSGQLVYRVGAEGPPVAAGSNWVGESPGSGSLMLAINVPAEESLESGGIYSVRVTAGSNGRLAGATAFYPASP